MIKSFIRKVIRGVSNYFYWRKIIWNDSNYSHYYTYTILLHKLKAVEKTFSNPENILQIESSRLHILKYVKIARTLLEKIIEDDFLTEEDQSIYKQMNFDWIECKDSPKMYELVSSNRPSETVLRDIREREKALRNKTRRLFFLVLEKRIEYWWD